MNCVYFVLVIIFITLCVSVKNSYSVPYRNTSYLRVIKQATSTGCILPPHPTFGHWTIYESSSQLSPGDVVPSRTILEINCQENYSLNGEASSACIRKKWTPKIGQCLRACPAINNTSTMKVTCTYNEKRVENCETPLDGTVARFSCAPFYEDQALERHPFRVCSGGSWSSALPECVPVCGQKSLTKDPTLIVGGSNVTRGDYPWQVALYNGTDKSLICGGSLLNERVILTAAHCVTDERGRLLQKEFFTLSVGKYFRKYNDNRDFNKAQFSSVDQIYTPRQYKGDIQNYFGDVAILVAKKSFILSERVQPVCIDWGSTRHQNLLDPTRTKFAYVTGWGFTVEHKDPSDVLKHLKVPLISDDECNENIPEDYINYMTDDKLCAGFLDSGTSVCKGDSGGGLVSKYKDRYYLVGIVSLSPQAPTQLGGCDSQQYALYTRVSYYVESFILEKEARFRPSIFEDVSEVPTTATTILTTEAVTRPSIQQGSCILPNHPQFGKWAVLGSFPEGLAPGVSVAPTTLLKVECDKNYKLEGNNALFCENGKWSSPIGHCLQTCPTRVNSPKFRVSCTHNDKKINCTDAIDGTLAKFQCSPFYEDLALDRKPVHLCQNGKWDQKEPQCVPVCGHIKGYAPNQSYFQRETVGYPWNVAIYSSTNKTLVCGGSLLSEKVILTAANCVTDSSGKSLAKENYILAVGKLYRTFNSSLEKTTQLSKIEDIVIPSDYRGDSESYLANIALVIVKKPFTLSRNVVPVCLDLKQSFNLSAIDQTGSASDWGFGDLNWIPEYLYTRNVHSSAISDCQKNPPRNLNKFYSHDKLCESYSGNGQYMCPGKGGGSLVFLRDDKYYLAGVVSVSSSGLYEECKPEQYGFYTNITAYANFILPKLEQYDT